MRLALLVPVVLAGCAGPGAGHETDARFVGEWMIDQPLHATYEASWYRFHDGGELEHLRDCSFGGPVPTGFVNQMDDAVRCHFASTWSAAEPETLVIDSVCTDDRAREIVLGFPTDTSANATGQSAVEVVAVDGETGWGHAPWMWVWHKCGASGCEPAIASCQ
jgi:hypothetical protein